MAKILIVEDNKIIFKGLEYLLTQEGFNVDSSLDVSDSKTKLAKGRYDLIILDVSLPDGDGFELCKYIQSIMDTPILFLTAKDDEQDVVKGFELGAQNYITKPFRNRELISRINNILRRNNNTNNIIVNGNIKIDLDKNRVYKDNKEIVLTALEYKILILLYSNIDKTVTREMILDKIWDIAGNFVNDNTLTVYVKRIRDKLDCGDIITIKGIGYRVNKHE